MNDSHHSEKNLHDQALSSLYHQTKQEQPSMALDSTILSQARSAVQKKRGISWWHFNWFIPLASTSVILLVVTLSWQNRETMLVSDQRGITTTVEKQHRVAQSEQSERLGVHLAEKLSPIPSLEQKDKAPASKTVLAEAEVRSEKVKAAPQVSRARKKEQFGIANFAAKQNAKSQLAADQSASGQLASNQSAVDQLSDSEVNLSQHKTDPDKWIKEIKLLLQQGNKTEANKQFKVFRKVFPDVDVDKQLLKELGIK